MNGQKYVLCSFFRVLTRLATSLIIPSHDYDNHCRLLKDSCSNTSRPSQESKFAKSNGMTLVIMPVICDRLCREQLRWTLIRLYHQRYAIVIPSLLACSLCDGSNSGILGIVGCENETKCEIPFQQVSHRIEVSVKYCHRRQYGYKHLKKCTFFRMVRSLAYYSLYFESKMLCLTSITLSRSFSVRCWSRDVTM